jgi:hypothetical protein
VTDAEGVFQGTNRIEKILGGCALQENWTGAKGVTGRSFNIYASGRGVWRISRDGGSTWNDAFVGLYHRQTE